MKKYISIILSSLLLTSATVQDAKGEDSSSNTSQFLEVHNPHIPENVVFADQTISFDRIDMYERLDRELTSMTYTHGNTLLVIKRANRFFPILAPILKEIGHSLPCVR